MQRLSENTPLLFCVARWADGIAEREIGEGESRNPDLIDDVSGGAEDEGRQSAFFEMASGQTDRLVTDRSKGNEDGEVHSVGSKHRENLGGPGLRTALAVDRRDANETW